MNLEWKNQLKQSYDQDAFRRSGQKTQGWKVEERGRFLEQLNEEEMKTLLEIGSGTGRDGLFFQENGLDVTCVDFSEENVRYCKEKGLRAQVMDFYQLDFPEASFESVYALNCLLHVAGRDMDGVLAGIRRVLKPGGLFYLGVYGGRDSEGIWEDDDCDPKRFFAFRTDKSIQAMAERHFTLLSFRAVPLERDDLHFQSLILRGKGEFIV